MTLYLYTAGDCSKGTAYTGMVNGTASIVPQSRTASPIQGVDTSIPLGTFDTTRSRNQSHNAGTVVRDLTIPTCMGVGRSHTR